MVVRAYKSLIAVITLRHLLREEKQGVPALQRVLRSDSIRQFENHQFVG
jgi:hypothetical protein